jgi:formamidopyrimidine-DNA glycosylase
MPELAEVETIVRGLRGPLTGRLVERARLRPAALYRSKSRNVRWLEGRRIAGVERVGKNTVFRFEPAAAMVVNLGMTGRLLVARSKDGVSAADKKHFHGRFRLDHDVELRYFDVRRFGFFYVTEADDIARELGIGPDPFDARVRYLERMLEARNAPIKALLLDQRIISGLGNIYADEALFDARIDPRTAGRATDARRVLASSRRILEQAIAHNGSTVRDYRRPDGTRGGYQVFHAVYGREAEPCVRCGTPIKKIVLAGRGTHFCPLCQR